MYTPIAPFYRAAIRVTVDGQHYYFTRQYFMAQFDRYVARQRAADSRPKLSKKKETPHLLQSIDDFLVASRSFDESVSKRWQWWFKVAGRTIEGGYDFRRYLRDSDLSSQYNGQFNKDGATYPEMSKFIHSNQVLLPDEVIVHYMIAICLGEQVDVSECPIIPLILSVLLVAEPSRNPMVFLPTLMLLDLIRQGRRDCYGGPYTLINSLSNPTLSSSSRELHKPMTFFGGILAKGVGMPTQEEVDDAIKPARLRRRPDPYSKLMLTVPGSDRSFFNVGGQHNGSWESHDTHEVKPSDLAMRAGGWFAMAARYSWTEYRHQLDSIPEESDGVGDAWLDGQDDADAYSESKRELTSFVKCFCVISDWLQMRGCALSMHKSDVQRLIQVVEFDRHPDVLESLFVDLAEGMSDYLGFPHAPILQRRSGAEDQTVFNPQHLFQCYAKAQESLDDGLDKHIKLRPGLNKKIEPLFFDDVKVSIDELDSDMAMIESGGACPASHSGFKSGSGLE